MSKKSHVTPKTQSKRSNGMSKKYCACGHAIGVTHTDTSTTFYDEFDRDKPITICPACNKRIKADKLQYSELQRKALVKAYRILIDLADSAEA